LILYLANIGIEGKLHLFRTINPLVDPLLDTKHYYI